MVQEFRKRRDVFVDGLNSIRGIRCQRPLGAFYLFPNVSGIFGKMVGHGIQINSAADLAGYLLDTAKVAIVPGEGFGAPEHVRFSYANSMENIHKGIERILCALPE
jgi:aspartate aminotransferase